MSTAGAPTEKRFYRFDEFSADPLRRVLLRDGEPVAITPKAFSILLVLLENRGAVVSKEELIRQVWASVYVSDANLTQTVSSLRKALGDRTGDRRYVVTVPGQGYCFAGPVSEASEEKKEETEEVSAFQPYPGSRPSTGTFPIFPETEKTGPIPADLRKPVRENLLRIALGLACLAGLLGLSFYLSRLDRGPLALPADLGTSSHSRRPSVAVLGFRDLSGKAGTQWLGSALTEMLNTELAAGGRLRVVSRENVSRARQVLDLPQSGTLDQDDLERVHSIVGSDLLVIGTYLVLEEGGARRIRLDVRVVEVASGDIAASLVEVGEEAGLFELVSRTGARLREMLGFEGLSPRQARSARALQPADPEAMRLYNDGLERLRSSDAPRALEALRRAAGIEPNSAVIRSALSEAYGMLGYDEQALAEEKRAVAFAGELPREPRLGIQARFHELSRDWNQASETYRSLWTFYPDNLEYGLKLANCLMRGGRPAEAQETVAALRRLPPPESEDARIDVLEARIALRLADPALELRAAEAAVAKGRRFGETAVLIQGLVFQGDALLTLGRVDPAVGSFRQALDLAKNGDSPMTLGMAYGNLGVALMRRGDLAEAETETREALAIAERIGTDVGIAAQNEVLGDLHRLRGELGEAQAHLEKALEVYLRLGDRTLQGRVRSNLGLILWARGDLDAARSSLEQALALSRETGNRAIPAVALTHVGRILERQGKLQEALRRHEEAFSRFRKLGDPGQSAGALAQSAVVLGRLGRPGDLETARKRFEQVLQTRRRLGDRIGIAEVLGALSNLQYRKGDLGSARRLADREAQIAAETGSLSLAADALRATARADQAADRLPQARRSLETALETLGPDPSLAATDLRLDLARLAVSEESFDEAGRLADEVASWCADREMIDGEVEALSLLADAYLRQGRLDDARHAAERARMLLGESADQELRVRAAARLARVDAAAGETGEAAGELWRELEAAQASGLAAAALEARLALGEVLLAAGDATGGRAALLEVRKEAEGRGFARLVREAGHALETGGVLSGWKSAREAGRSPGSCNSTTSGSSRWPACSGAATSRSR
ncbi:MAG TPA: tetratricopeptide repeat protein [Thermoanaerobaculia bacterium]|jgi:DNA-binding winged helix-turn-helix (wHTH) protein/tetratricopeptide (TPR) repeat protein/TolB-like protein|nr:tetratricopeptide repeat protein [Thermoanaerobaculia bacterium]